MTGAARRQEARLVGRAPGLGTAQWQARRLPGLRQRRILLGRTAAADRDSFTARLSAWSCSMRTRAVPLRTMSSSWAAVRDRSMTRLRAKRPAIVDAHDRRAEAIFDIGARDDRGHLQGPVGRRALALVVGLAIGGRLATPAYHEATPVSTWLILRA